MSRFTYFVTRDSDPDTGALTDYVEVWFAKPIRHRVGDRGACWVPPDAPSSTLRFARWPLEECLRRTGTIPDDDRQCLRVEGDAIRTTTPTTTRAPCPPTRSTI